MAFNVKGLSIKDIINFDYNIINKLNNKDLRTVTSRLISASNKRIKRMLNSDIGKLSPSLRSIKKYGYFSIKGKSFQEVKSMFSIVRDWLTNDTSSLSRFKAYKKTVESKLGVSFSPKQWTKFWEVFSYVRNNHSALFNALGSKQAKQYISTIVNANKLKGLNTLKKLVADNLDDIYTSIQNDLNSIDVDEDGFYDL